MVDHSVGSRHPAVQAHGRDIVFQRVPEVTPPRFDVTDVDGIGDHLAAEGFAVVKAAATATELDLARSLLWQHLEGRDDGSAGALLGSVGVGPNRRPQGRPTGWLRSDPTTWRVGHNDGLLTSSTHSDCLWYVRTRPGVVSGFAAAYGCGSDTGHGPPGTGKTAMQNLKAKMMITFPPPFVDNPLVVIITMTNNGSKGQK